jgi:hypothetical protein
MSSFNFLLKCYNIYIKEILFHLESISKGVKTKRVGGGEERTNRFLLHHRKIFRGAPPKMERNGKNKARKGQDWASPLFCPSQEHAL